MKISNILFIIGVILLIISLVIISQNKVIDVKEVPCYDSEHHIIKEVKCQENIYNNANLFGIIISFGILFLVMSYVIYIMDWDGL